MNLEETVVVGWKGDGGQVLVEDLDNGGGGVCKLAEWHEAIDCGRLADGMIHTGV